MTDRLQVLVVESDRGAADEAARELERAGHTVARCHERQADVFPCNGLTPAGCPLERQVVDVVLDVRARPGSQPQPGEDGATCAVRQHVPLVVAGPPATGPYDAYAAVRLHRTYDVVAACEEAATAPLPRHTEVARAALAEVLGRRGGREVSTVTVRRNHGTLVVDVGGLSSADHATRSMAAVRVTGALRALDRHARGVDVVFG
jgi:hypothetical protein